MREPVNLVPIAVFEKEFDDVSVLQLIKLVADLQQMVFVQVTDTSKLLDIEHVAYDGRTLEKDQGADSGLTRQLLHEIVSH